MIWTGNAPGSRGHKLPEDAEILNVAERTTMGKTGPGDNRWNIRSEKAIGRRRVVQQERGTVKGQANVPFAKIEMMDRVGHETWTNYRPLGIAQKDLAQANQRRQ